MGLTLCNESIDSIVPYILDAPKTKANGITLYSKLRKELVTSGPRTCTLCFYKH